MRNVSRRTFMKGTAGVGLAAGLTPLSTSMARAEPKRGGHLRIGLEHGNTTDGYDPAIWDNGYSQCFAFSRHSYLTEIAPNNALEPSLAEGWEASADAKTWSIQLREGVEFHSGKSVTVDDVIASLNYHRGDDSTSAAKPIVDPIVDITADGSHRVTVELEAGNADFPFILSAYHLPIMPSSEGAIDPTTSDGCGPYTVASFEPGVRAHVVRYPNYHRSDRAWFDEAEILSIVDGVARQNALLTGEVDIIDSVDLNTIHLLSRRGNVQVFSVSGTQHYTFAMDTRAAPFNDNNVRLALKYAVDREELVEKILNGYGVVGNDHPIGRSNRFHASELEQRTYDPDKARFHLQQAGLDSLDVSLSAADAAFSGAVDAAVLYAEKAAAVGVNINVVREPNDGYWSNVWMIKPWSAVYWGGRPTEDWMFSTAYSSGAAWNDSFWENARFNELLGAARSELNDELRREMYVEMQTIVNEDGGVVIPMFASYVGAHSDAIAHGDDIAANWAMDGWKVVERWWFA